MAVTRHTTLIVHEALAALVERGAAAVIDCRFSLGDTEAGRRAYLAGHVPGAVYAHLDEDLSGPVAPKRTGRHPLPDPDAFRRRLEQWGVGDGRQVVAYDDQGGAIAARLWWMLRWLGHDAVAVLDGGWTAWRAAGGAAETDVPRPAPGRLTPRLRPELVASADDVESARESADQRVLDARALERFRGDVEPIDPVAGHIPGARSFPLTENLESGRFRSAAEIRERMRRVLGEVSPERAIVYCGSGVTACHVLLAAEHAGLGSPRLYAGSWSEWIADGTRPVARGE